MSSIYTVINIIIEDFLFLLENFAGIDNKAYVKILTYDFAFRDGIFKLVRSPGIDSKESISAAYVAWRTGTPTMVLLGS